MIGILIRRRKGTQRHRSRVKAEAEVVVMPRIASSHQKLGERHGMVSP